MKFHHLGAHSKPHPWQVDPLCQALFIHQGMACNQWPVKRTYAESPMKIGQYMPGSTAEDIVLLFIPCWPITDYKMPVDIAGRTIVAAHALQSADYRLLAATESPAGQECDVFDRQGMDRIWLSRKPGACVMQRDFRDPKSGNLIQRLVTDKVTQIAPGLWLPAALRCQLFAANSGAKADVVEREFRLNLLKCALNDQVSDAAFIVVHRPGSLKYVESQFTQMTSGGEDLLTDIVTFMVQYLHLPSRRAAQAHPYLWLAMGLACGLVFTSCSIRWSPRAPKAETGLTVSPAQAPDIVETNQV